MIKIILPLSHFVCSLFYFGISQNIVLFLKIKVINLLIVKLLFTTLCFVGLYFVPNLIVMLFNLLYPIFIVGFHCKGCALERESVKT